MLPPISLTTFVDFVIASGTPRLTVVRKAKEQYLQKYEPPFDYWKQLREAIVDGHAAEAPAEALKHLLANLDDKRKIQNYTACANGYAKWLGKKNISWLGAMTQKWTSGDLIVRVNPEIGLLINGQKHIIKLYFKQQQLSKLRVDTVLHLLHSTVVSKENGMIAGVLDVRNGKLISPTVSQAEIHALLVGEALAFSGMWKAL